MAARRKPPVSVALRGIAAIMLVLALGGCDGDADAVRRDACGARVRPPADTAIRLTYRGSGNVAADVPIICRRLGALKFTHQVLGAGRDEIVIVVAPAHAEAARAAAAPGRLVFYDWEANVLGPGGTPAPADPAVTGGAAAGHAGGLAPYDAVLRASRRAADPAPDNARRGSRSYAVDAESDKVYGSGSETRAGALALVPTAERDRAKVREVKSGTVVVRAARQGDVGAGDERWYVLRDDVALRGDAIENPKQRSDDPAGGAGAPVVTFDFTREGAQAFVTVTRELAARGKAAAGARPAAEANQHFAIVLDDRILSVPSVDFRANPDGIDASTGGQIAGGFTVASAKQLADVLRSGVLPVALEPVGAP